MATETRATSYAHDPAVGLVVVCAAKLSTPGEHGQVHARLLLDRARHIVGIVVNPDSPQAHAVTLGPGDAVVATEEATAYVDGTGRTLTLHGAAARGIAPGANPYVG